jgi:alpha-glucosidase
MLVQRMSYFVLSNFAKRSCFIIGQRNYLAAVIFFFISSLFTSFLYAQINTAGKILTYQRSANGISGELSNGIFKIDVYNASIIRVRVKQNGAFRDFSYALADTALPLFTEWSISEKESIIYLETNTIKIQVEKAPHFRVTFRNNDGVIINQDVAGMGFGTSFIGERSTLYKVLQPGERFVGLGEVLGNLDKRGSGFTLNNTDTYKYGDPRLSMYTSIPFYIGMHTQVMYGLFYHNTYKTFFNFGLSTPGFSSITADGGDVDYFFIHDADMAGILKHYTALTGRMPLPPKWSIGYHQSRCSYYPQQQVELLAENFRKKELPIDCIVLDADYLFEYEPFRINTQRFPDLRSMATRLKKMGIELTASVNPGIKIDTTYAAYHDGLKQDVFIKYADGSKFTSDIWPNTNHFPDFTKPASRAWWRDQMKFLPEHGVHGYWNDMNEPAVGGSYLPDNLLFDFDGRKATSLEAKNLYGFLMARSSYEAAVKYGGNRRPFVLTRSGFAGVQRYAAVWTGDNTAKDEHLLGGALLNTQMGLSGVPFVGDDIGGYIGPASKELFTRWMQVGMFSPFARNHKEAWSHANEPWAFGEETEAIARAFMKFRYRLMPYLYSAFYEAAQTGMPIARSLCMYFPFDEKVYHPLYQYQFMCGPALLVVPVSSSEKMKSFYLPAGNWYNLYTDEKMEGARELQTQVPMHQIPLFVKESSMIPMQTDVLSANEKPSDTLRLHVYYGGLKNEYTWYEDDGETMDYQQGMFMQRKIIFDPAAQTISMEAATGKRVSHIRFIEFVLHGFPDAMRTFSVNGKRAEVKPEKMHLLDGLQYLEDLYDKNYFAQLRTGATVPAVRTFLIPNTSQNIRVQWE